MKKEREIFLMAGSSQSENLLNVIFMQTVSHVTTMMGFWFVYNTIKSLLLFSFGQKEIFLSYLNCKFIYLIFILYKD